MQKDKKEETFVPFHPVDKEKERRKKESFYLKIFGVCILFTVIMFILLLCQEDSSDGTFVCATLFVIGFISMIVTLIKGNKYINKEETIKHSKPSITTSITCPYCKSTNTKKITNTSKAVHTAIFGIFSISRNSKQWHCNSCGSDF